MNLLHLFALTLLAQPVQESSPGTELTPNAQLASALSKLQAADSNLREQALRNVLALQPKLEALVEELSSDRQPIGGPSTSAGWSLGQARDSEGVQRPYQLYVPQAVLNSGTAAQLLVHMHGAVSRDNFSTELGQGLGSGASMWIPAAEELGFVVAFPLGNAESAWWSNAGVRNVRAVVRDVQRRLAIQSDSIVATGFSDGASGCYYLAMTDPEPFVAFLPMNGHPRVASAASQQQLYPENLGSRPMFVVMTQDDSLYPAADVLPHLNVAFQSGAPMHLLAYPFGGHQPIYFEEQRDAFLRFIREARQIPSPSIEWFSAHDQHRGSQWLSVVKRGSALNESELPSLAEVTQRPSPIRLGVSIDESTSDQTGVGLAEVTEGGLAEIAGLLVEDRLVSLAGTPTPDTSSLIKAIGQLQRGQTAPAEILRAGLMIQVRLEVPAARASLAYPRERATSWARAWLEGDVLQISTHGILQLRIDLPEELFGNDSVHVHLNGEHINPRIQTRSNEELLRRWATQPCTAGLVQRYIEITLELAASPR